MKSNKLFCLFIILYTVLTSVKINAQIRDSVVTFWLNPVEITSSRTNLGESEIPVEKDNLSNILAKNGFSLIRKGVFFAQDIYSEGFKRGDINVIIDGERYHSACPNRMDSPLTRVNPIELSNVNLKKTAGSLQSGIGGVVEFQRSEPGENIKFQGGFSGTAAASQSVDGAFLIEGKNNRINLRYSSGKPYEDADGRSFKDNYNYKTDTDYMLSEASLHGKYESIKYTAAFTYSEDISFPYLSMDERINRIFNSSLSYKGNKIYFNYTRHIMDNALRVSQNYMISDAENFTIGAIGDFYEVFYRNWNLDNEMIMANSTMENKIIPDLSSLSASVIKKFELGNFIISAKAGLINQRLGDESQMSLYQTLYPGAKSNRLFPVFAAVVSYSSILGNEFDAQILAETASSAPEIESLYISVKRPMMNPNWVGNPDLDQAVKASLRGSINYKNLRMELFGTNVWNYVNQTQITINGKRNVTYKNVNAYMFGLNFDADWKYLNISANYTYAQNKTNDSPLAEIPPFKITSTIYSPEFSGLTGFIRHTFNDSQTRVDLNLSEKSTPSWNKLDAGISYTIKTIRISLEIENITNELYYQHLSYSRDPFASGATVFEPGRTIRFNIKYDNVF